MVDHEQDQDGEQPTGQASTPTVDGTVAYSGVSQQEIDDGKALAILSYALSFVELPFFLIPLIMRNNEFSLFHAKQSMMIWIAAMALWFITVLLFCAGGLGFFLLPLVIVFLLVMNILGIVNAVQGAFKPLPLIGGFAEDWFGGIRKAPQP